MAIDVKPGNIVRLKKPHPCGSFDWEVIRTGADIGLRCLGCQHRIMLDRKTFERKVKSVQPDSH
jgi:hypothetical protein